MINKLILLEILLLSTSIVCAQKKKIEELKLFALCDCVNNNYQSIDSTFYSSDVTN